MDHQISKNYPISTICIDPHKNPNIYVIYVKLDKNIYTPCGRYDELNTLGFGRSRWLQMTLDGS